MNQNTRQPRQSMSTPNRSIIDSSRISSEPPYRLRCDEYLVLMDQLALPCSQTSVECPREFASTVRQIISLMTANRDTMNHHAELNREGSAPRSNPPDSSTWRSSNDMRHNQANPQLRRPVPIYANDQQTPNRTGRKNKHPNRIPNTLFQHIHSEEDMGLRPIQLPLNMNVPANNESEDRPQATVADITEELTVTNEVPPIYVEDEWEVAQNSSYSELFEPNPVFLPCLVPVVPCYYKFIPVNGTPQIQTFKDSSMYPYNNGPKFEKMEIISYDNGKNFARFDDIQFEINEDLLEKFLAKKIPLVGLGVTTEGKRIINEPSGSAIKRKNKKAHHATKKRLNSSINTTDKEVPSQELASGPSSAEITGNIIKVPKIPRKTNKPFSIQSEESTAPSRESNVIDPGSSRSYRNENLSSSYMNCSIDRSQDGTTRIKPEPIDLSDCKWFQDQIQSPNQALHLEKEKQGGDN